MNFAAPERSAMLSAKMQAWLQKRHMITLCSALLVILLATKYLWTAFAFDMPLGYDAGIYRYLFLKYRDAFPFIPALDPWALEQPPGFFLLFALPLQMLPVDWFLGFIWNLMPVLLAVVLAAIFSKRDGATIGLLVLFWSVLSIAQYYGFLAMYWKTFASLLLMIVTFALLERKSYVAILTGAMTVAIHQQTAVLFLVTVASWGMLQALQRRTRTSLYLLGLFAAAAAIGILFYIPVWSSAVLPHLERIAAGGPLPAGSFPDIGFFFVHQGVLLFFGLLGLLMSLKSEKGTLWQWAVLWSLLFVVLHFFFYRRFLLHLDFFLLPFAAHGLLYLWKMRTTLSTRLSIVLLLLIQTVATAHAIHPEQFPVWCQAFPMACRMYPAIPVEPDIGSALLEEIKTAEPLLPPDAYILSLEPISTPWLRGWLPEHRVAGPGIFSSPWDEAGWEVFFFGSTADRHQMLASLPQPLFLHLTPIFMQYYGESVTLFLQDSCFQEMISPSFIRVHCS
ncbi:MAG TPA: hypothetical protein VI873_01180 [Candidatus Peribacteraceae bacterium]|nr:hypothetical protein [Candidatus Peribacteraceae bacterium]